MKLVRVARCLVGASLLFVTQLLVGGPVAWAGGYSVNPVLLTLTATAPNARFSIRNDSDAAVRVQVSAVTWAQDEKGMMQLAKTDDLVVYPLLLSLAGGEQRSIRIGTTAKAGAVERTYRVLFEELPPTHVAASGPSQIRVLTNISIPVFLVPDKPGDARIAVDSFALAHGSFQVAVANRGAAHFRVRQVRVTASAADGAAAFDSSVDGWYVLAGGLLRRQLPVAADECAKLKKAIVTVDSDAGTATAELAVPPDACLP